MRQSVFAESFLGRVLRIKSLVFAFLLISVDFTTSYNSNPLRKKEWEADWNAIAQESLQEALRLKPNLNVAKNTILFIGDGMGLPTITAGRIYVGQLQNQPGEEYKLHLEKFPYVALAKTYNVNHQVPDSAGTATAYLCGVKTNYGVIGVNQNVTEALCENMTPENHVDSILRWSKNEGKRVGVVTNARVTHATPAPSYAHCAHRYWEDDSQIPESAKSNPNCNQDIALQLVRNNSDINVILGGGRARFFPKTVNDIEYVNQTGLRSDGLNLIEEWKQAMESRGENFSYVWNKTAFEAVDPESTDFLLGLFEPSHMRYTLERSTDGAGEPSLVEMTEKAIRILSRGDKGFFLLVEGGRIDQAHHDNYGKKALDELREFDEAVAKALTLVDEKDTLIVVTADHSHVFAMGGYPSRGNPILGVVDEYAFNMNPPDDELPYLTLMYTNGVVAAAGRKNLTDVNTTADNFRQSALVPLYEESHGGEDVAIFARGPMAHLFHGVQEQHYIAHVMAYASCVGQNKDHCNTASAPTTSATAATCSTSVSSATSLRFLSRLRVNLPCFVILVFYISHIRNTVACHE